MPDFTLFLSAPVDEQTLLTVFERESGISCESLSLKNEAAPAFLSLLEYSEGYPLAVSIAWPPGCLRVQVDRVASALAKEAKVLVLYEGEMSASETAAEQWFLAEPELEIPRPVRIKELQHGILPAEPLQ